MELYGYPKKCITLEDLNQAFIPEVVGDFLFIAKGIGCIYPIKGRVHVKHHAVEIESVLETIDKLFSLQETLFKKIEKIEIWNLVFKQFETLANGERNKLLKTLIERIIPSKESPKGYYYSRESRDFKSAMHILLEFKPFLEDCLLPLDRWVQIDGFPNVEYFELSQTHESEKAEYDYEDFLHRCCAFCTTYSWKPKEPKK